MSGSGIDMKTLNPRLKTQALLAAGSLLFAGFIAMESRRQGISSELANTKIESEQARTKAVGLNFKKLEWEALTKHAAEIEAALASPELREKMRADFLSGRVVAITVRDKNIVRIVRLGREDLKPPRIEDVPSPYKLLLFVNNPRARAIAMVQLKERLASLGADAEDFPAAVENLKATAAREIKLEGQRRSARTLELISLAGALVCLGVALAGWRKSLFAQNMGGLPMTQNVRLAPAVLGPIMLLAFVVAIIFHVEGLHGFVPFVNVESMLLVFGGTLLLLWSSYPLRDIFLRPTPRMIAHASDCAIALGVAGTVLGFILMLADISDVAHVPMRIALAMTSLFYGLVLAEVILAPIGHRLQRTVQTSNESEPSLPAARRRFLAFLGIGAVLVSLFAVLYALTATLTPPAAVHVVQPKTDPEVPGFSGIKKSQIGTEFLKMSGLKNGGFVLCQVAKGDISKALGIEPSGPLETIDSKRWETDDITKVVPAGQRIFLLSTGSGNPLVCATPERVGLGLALQIRDERKTSRLSCMAASPETDESKKFKQGFESAQTVEAADLVEAARKVQAGDRLRIKMAKLDIYCRAY